MKPILMLFPLLLCSALPAQPQKPDEAAAIRKVALDYIEGWYSGDAKRMERALHPELAKRMVSTDPGTGRSLLDQKSAMTLIQATRAGLGRGIPSSRQRHEITILDIYHNAASVKIVASDWVDYLHLARWNGEWKIINVLWERTPKE